MPRNLVICFDGTNNQFGVENTSVVRLVQVMARDPDRQVLFYDAGVGTLPEPGLITKAGKRVSDWIGLAFGAGLTKNVEEGYAYLMESWEPGDRVFLFGFSRGAYTARVLAGMLHVLGLLPRASWNLVPYAMRLFKAIRQAGNDDGRAKSSYWKLCDEFRWTFARPFTPDDDQRHFQIHFLGVWDTVSSVGWVWDPASFSYTKRNPSVHTARHAVAVDERRWFFRQNLMSRADGQDLDERWFPGVHSDVGGGYPEGEGGLWRPAFAWMLSEAEKAGLLLDQKRLSIVLTRGPSSQQPWSDPQHESLTPFWWAAEFFPKLQWRARLERRLPQIGLGRHRRVATGARMDRSTLLRIQAGGYTPPNLSKAFLEKVRGMGELPRFLPYEA